MNDDLEQRLAALRPAELPPEVQASLASPPVQRGKIRWLLAAGPLAAAACWLLIISRDRPPAPAPPPVIAAAQPSDYHVFVPVGQTSRLVSLEDLAVIDANSATPTKLVRATWIDDVTYAGDDGHSRIQRRQARAEIIPVTLDTY